MALEKRQIGLSALIAGVIAAGSAGSTATKWWPYVGWKTPNSHSKDIKNLQTANGVLVDKIDCRQFKTELEGLYAQVDAGNDSRQLSDRIERQRDIMDGRRCDRFGTY